MMDSNDQRLSMTDINGQTVLMPNIDMSNIVMDEHIMQLFGSQNYMMTDGTHLADNQRAVNTMDSVNSEHNPLPPMDRHSVDSCNYVSNQFEGQYHDSPDSHRFKYRSSGLSTVAETVSHVSETDNSISGQNYGNVNTSVGNIAVQPNYPMNSLNNWSHNQNHSNHSMGGQHPNRTSKELMINTGLQNNHLNTKVTPHSGYIPRQRISNFVPSVASMNPSTTSTPVNQSHNNLVILNNNNNNNNHNNIDNINKNNSQVLSDGLVQTRRLDSPIVTKRTVIIFKVIDQIVDNSGKVLKETVIKNEEIVKNLGKFDYNESSVTPLSSISNVSRFASNTNSGVLADVSSSVRSTSSSGSPDIRQNQNNESLTKRHSININEELNKNATQTPVISMPTQPIQPLIIDNNFNKIGNTFTQNLEIRTAVSTEVNNQNVTNSEKVVKQEEEPKISERDEEERRETATALLCLTQRSCSLNIDCNSDDNMFSADFSIKAGNKVMAKWRDKNFYPAVISKQMPNNKWSVTFEDKATRSLFETELIQLNQLVIGQDLMVTISDGFCAKATIRALIYENNELLFEVEHLKDNKNVIKRYQLKDVFLNTEQSANIAIKAVKPTFYGAVFADVDLDNIVSGKRARITTKTETTEKPAQLFKNGKRRAADSVSVDADYEVDDSEDNDHTFGVKTKKKANNVRIKKRAESHNQMFNSDHSSLSISPRTTKVHTSLPTQELIKLLGPLPEVGSKIFEKMSFLLTCGDRNKCDDLSVEQSNPERSTPFDKLYLAKQIETGGGKVFESFIEMKNSEENLDMVLIADTYHRSIKYIQCLAGGISIASHLWVIDCCRQNKYLKRDNYTLPAGFSIITSALPSDKNTFKKSSTLFKGTKFYFGSKSPEKLESLWAPVLSAAQAVIVNHSSINTTTLSRDTSCCMELVKKAKQMKIPVISSEYIVQCLINGRKLAYDASPLFSYTYDSTNNL